MWCVFWSVVEDLGIGPDGVLFYKVKSHSTVNNVVEGRMSLVERQGNGEADTEAKRGAALHALPFKWVLCLRALDSRVERLGR